MVVYYLLPGAQAEGECAVLAACGTAHSVLLMDTGAVYTAGCNSSGQCGRDLALQEVRTCSQCSCDDGYFYSREC